MAGFAFEMFFNVLALLCFSDIRMFDGKTFGYVRKFECLSKWLCDPKRAYAAHIRRLDMAE